MNIKPLHTGFIMPTKGSDQAGAFDLYMPEPNMTSGVSKLIGLGFAAAVPLGFVALLVPRSGVGAKFGLELNNTVGVIDSDYRGEWMAALRTKNGLIYQWDKGARILQFMLVPVATSISLTQVEDLDTTARGDGGFGSSGM